MGFGEDSAVAAGEVCLNFEGGVFVCYNSQKILFDAKI